MSRFLSPRTIRRITRLTMAVMWFMAFFSVGRYQINAITFKETMHSIAVYMVCFIINGIIYICSEN